MKLYRRYIRPMHSYPGQHYEPKTEPIEKEEKWYPEAEREYLENKYGYLNKRPFSDLVFEEKYEPYDDLILPKEQEAVPRHHKCIGETYALINEEGTRFCPWCGKAVKWDG